MSNALNVTKGQITDILEMLNVTPDEISKIEIQWRNLTLVQWNNIEDTQLFWSEVSVYCVAAGVNPFKDIAKIARSVLCIPHSNAEVEKIFSQMSIVKSKHGNRIKPELLNAILSIRAGLKRNAKTC